MNTKTVMSEPMTLIDPVTGLLILMRESEDEQYIPVTNIPESNKLSPKTAMLEPTILIDPVTGILTPMQAVWKVIRTH